MAFEAGSKAKSGVLVANTVGSNIFLGTLVLGVTMLVHGNLAYGEGEEGTQSSAATWDTLVMLGSSLVLFVLVWVGNFSKGIWIGSAMLVLYVVYLLSVFFRAWAVEPEILHASGLCHS